ncbi:MAG: ATP-grasp domain-containing protein [Spirochaetia bacterium]|nr:ATP-grasp domain-containing protein [Spirochaetia bacterium]
MAKVFVSIGAGAQQMPLIEAAQRLGFAVAAIDRNPEAPGFQLSEHSFQCSIKKPATMRRMLAELNGEIRGIAARSFGPALLSSSALCQAFGVPGPGNSSVAFFKNKRRFKSALMRTGIQCPKSFSWKSQYERNAIYCAGPLIARPISGFGKLNLEILRDMESKRAFLNAVDDESMLLEELLEGGTELTVLGAAHEGEYKNLMVTSKEISMQPPLFAEIMHRYPASVPDKVLCDIESIVQRLVSLSGLRTSPLVSEFIYLRGQLYLIEASPEIGGEFLADFAFTAATGQSYFDWLVRLLTEDKMPAIPPAGHAAVIHFLLPQKGTFQSVQFPDWLHNSKEFLFEKVLLGRGKETSLKMGNLERPAVFGLTSTLESIESLVALARKAAEQTRINYATS